MFMPGLGAVLVLSILCSGCARELYQPERATRAYPDHLHTTDVVDIQVFRDGEDIHLVNSTARSYADFALWINQQYVHRVESFPTGSSLRLSLWDFYDERGERVNAGGFLRAYEPTPVRMVEMQLDDEQPMVGLITIRAEDVEPQVRR